MADEHEVKHVNWTEVFSFTRIFKSCKMALHISKMILALSAIVLIFIFGWGLDRIWSIGNSYVRPGEIMDHCVKSDAAFDADKQKFQDGRLSEAVGLKYRTMLQLRSPDTYSGRLGNADLRAAFDDAVRKANGEITGYTNPDAARMEKEAKDNNWSWSRILGEAEKTFKEELVKIDDTLEKAVPNAKSKIEAMEIKSEEKKVRVAEVEKAARLAIAEKTRLTMDFNAEVDKVRGKPIFAGFRAYEVSWLENSLSAVRQGNITGGLTAYSAMIDNKDRIAPPAAADAVPVVAGENAPGFLVCLLMCVQGFAWLFSEHWVFASLLTAFSLGVWALFGGAIYRIAALHAAREEKISVVHALKFSLDKFASFVTAPLLPVAIILVLALVMDVLVLLMNVPYLGAVYGLLVGALFFVFLLMGLASAFLLAGLVGGGALMYPTIAVEGSDSFDAISRSFSYVLSRPWRAGLYGLVALVYGTITYLVVRLFVFAALWMTHAFLKWGVFTGGDTLGPDADKMDVLWGAPTFDNLCGATNGFAASGMESIIGWMIHIWVFLLAATVAAYLISYFASSSTVIYLLLRRKVDATDYDDVYVDEAAEPAVPALNVKPAEAPAAQTPAETKPAEPTAPADSNAPAEPEKPTNPQ